MNAATRDGRNARWLSVWRMPCMRAAGECGRGFACSDTSPRLPSRAAGLRIRRSGPESRRPTRRGPSVGGWDSDPGGSAPSALRRICSALLPFLSALLSDQVSERTKVEVQILVSEAKGLLELVHPLREGHERRSEALDLLRSERSAFDPVHGLALHELAQQLDHGHHELRQTLLKLLTIGVDAACEPRVNALELLAEQTRR